MTIPAPGPQSVSFDARPLTDAVDPKDVSAFIRAARSRRRGGSGMQVNTIILIVVAAIMLPVALTMAALGIMATVLSGVPLFVLPFVLILLVIIGVGAVMLVNHRRKRVARYRLSRFASANGMTYEDQISNPPLPGMIFHLGSSRQATQLVRGHTPRFVEFGNYQYTVRSGKNSTTYRWGYVAVKLDVPLPNIVLDALGNNGFGSNLPASFRRDQRLSLEGDFDRYFTLYCPEGYERDALYLFTPDIMARFVDNAAQLDVEIVDDWLFLYTKRAASTLDPATWAWLFGAVGALIVKFDQWARWRDERLLAEQGPSASIDAGPGSHTLPFAPPPGMLTPPPGVAREGRRLKRSTRWVLSVLFAVLMIAWAWVRIVT